MRIAYVIGLGRSGSTLLDLMLNAHSRAHTLGEVKKLKSYAQGTRRIRRKARGHLTNGNRCTCQAETIWDCEFWSHVNQVLQERHELSLSDLDIQSRNDRRFRQDNKALLQAVGEVSGAQVIVDSSKSLERLLRLRKIPELDVYPLRIVRNPWGRTNSVRKDRSKIYTAAIHYSYDALRSYTALYSKSHKMVRYENLVLQPEKELYNIMRFLGLDFEYGQLDWARHESHNIAGNRMRRGQDSTLKLDISWKDELTNFQKIMISLFSAPGRVINNMPR